MPDLEHLPWQKLTIQPAARRKGSNYVPPPIPLRDPSEHGVLLATRINSAVSSIQVERQRLGLNPSQMLVIEFTSRLDTAVRKILEVNLGLHILSEVALERELNPPIYIFEVHTPSVSDKNAFINNLDRSRLGIEGIEPVRNSRGQEDERKIRLLFINRLSAKTFQLNTKNQYEENVLWKVLEVATRNRETFYKTLVQFSGEVSLENLRAELSAYRTDGPILQLTTVQRATLFDAFEDAHAVTPSDRLGIRASQEGFPREGEFYFDLDLWHTGENADEERKSASLAIQRAGGIVSDIKAVADMLILVRVRGTFDVAERLLTYDRVSRLDLPPVLPAQLFDVINNNTLPNTPVFRADMPRLCVVDSGIMPSHPLLSGAVIDSRDFSSGDGTSVDMIGHGTRVAGIAVYGDIAHAMQHNRWVPQVQVVNAKVLGQGQLGSADFADETRAETQIEEAIRWAVSTQDCRVFNLSLGNPASMYSHGHQLPWALLLDSLIRELDIIIIVSAGNNDAPVVPTATSRSQLQKKVLENIYEPSHALIDPATAATVLTVGAIARTDQPSSINLIRYPGDVYPPIASLADCPSPFTRAGICDGRGGGLHRTIKPDLVGYGGNNLLKLAAPPYEWMGDSYLGEPSFAFDYATQGRLFTSACGTSFAAPYVAHIAARVEHSFKTRSQVASSNLVRALVVNSAKHTSAARAFVSMHRTEDTELSMLRAMGYGKPNVETSLYSSDNRVVLYAEDEVLEGGYDLYELRLPEEFVRESGRRRIRLTLAYDPPVRGARKEYLARTMWFELFRDATAVDIQRFQADTLGRIIKTEKLTHTVNQLEWSTVQSASYEIANSIKVVSNGEPRLFHVMVCCQKRFDTGEEPFQRYALTATLEHDKNDVRFHETVKVQLDAQRIRNRARLRSSR